MDIADTGVPINPIANGITYGILSRKQIGISRTTSVSFGENRRYTKNMSRNPAPSTMVHSRLNAYRCSIIKIDAMSRMKFMGMKEHIKATIKTTVILSMLSMYPILELIRSNDISANKNFNNGVIYTSYLLYRVIKICFATSKPVIFYPYLFTHLAEHACRML